MLRLADKDTGNQPLPGRAAVRAYRIERDANSRRQFDIDQGYVSSSGAELASMVTSLGAPEEWPLRQASVR
jgi:hypothetical protein